MRTTAHHLHGVLPQMRLQQRRRVSSALVYIHRNCVPFLIEFIHCARSLLRFESTHHILGAHNAQFTSALYYCGNVDSRAAPTVFLSPGYYPTYPCSTPLIRTNRFFTHIVNLCGVGPVAQIISPPPAPHNCTFPPKFRHFHTHRTSAFFTPPHKSNFNPKNRFVRRTPCQHRPLTAEYTPGTKTTSVVKTYSTCLRVYAA